MTGQRRAVHQGVGVVRQLGVGVQEEQHLRGAGRGTGVHLRGPAARCHQRQIGMLPRDLQRVVAVATVDHHNAHSALAKALQVAQRRQQALALGEDRHHDAQCGLHAFAAAGRSRHASCRWSNPEARVGLMTAK